ncbi:hypothetical protein [Cellulomonas xiejunii]|uniref:hypothetical protein n=1 Tax=Cellulomonas xiejunii TaxID=2968083 RepID=UPI001D0F318D|nr:hypothetical protein [Cellulomonas xiejunii]MCC2315035.1 hypothetical protein [Cellulomonas xiejunii]
MTSSTPARRRTVVVAVAAAALLAAAACTSTASAGGSDKPAERTTYKGGETTFGQSFAYSNGLAVEVEKPSAFVPSASADGAEGVDGEPVKVRVYVVNGTSGEFVPNTLEVTVVSDGEEAAQILDPGSRVELTGPGHALGRADVVAFDLAFVVQDPDDVTLTLVPAIAGYEPLVFTAP